jgi:hypothetical protein
LWCVRGKKTVSEQYGPIHSIKMTSQEIICKRTSVFRRFQYPPALLAQFAH